MQLSLITAKYKLEFTICYTIVLLYQLYYYIFGVGCDEVIAVH
jgi:hypothetical protein